LNRRVGALLLSLVVALGVGLACFRGAGLRGRPLPFAPVIGQVQMRQVPSDTNDTGAASYHIVMFVGYRGARPSWWGQADGMLYNYNKTVTNIRGKGGPQFLNPCFVSSVGRRYGWNAWGETPSLYDPTRQEYFVDMVTDVSTDFDLPGSTLTGTIRMGDGSTAQVSALAFQALQHSPAPSVMCP